MQNFLHSGLEDFVISDLPPGVTLEQLERRIKLILTRSLAEVQAHIHIADAHFFSALTFHHPSRPEETAESSTIAVSYDIGCLNIPISQDLHNGT